MKLRICSLIMGFMIFAVLTGTAAAQSVTVYGTQWENHIYAENGTDELVKCYSQNAVIRIPAYPEAETKINAALADIENQLMSECRTSAPNQGDMFGETTTQSENHRPMYILEMRSELIPQRISGGVVSFRTVDYMYSGGAHGMYGINGRTFDALTGQELSLDDLCARPEAFREACVSEMVRQGLLMDNLWFTTVEELQPAMEAIAGRAESWYLTDEGIVFHSSPYELAPYSEGALEFLVPYSLLPGSRY